MPPPQAPPLFNVFFFFLHVTLKNWDGPEDEARGGDLSVCVIIVIIILCLHCNKI